MISPQAEILGRTTTHATVSVVFTALPFLQTLLFLDDPLEESCGGQVNPGDKRIDLGKSWYHRIIGGGL